MLFLFNILGLCLTFFRSLFSLGVTNPYKKSNQSISYYIYGHKYLITVGNKPTVEDKKSNISVFQLFSQLLKSPLQLTIVVILLLLSIYAGFTFEGTDHWGYGALFIFLSLVTGMMMMIYKTLNNKIDKDRYIVLLLSFMLVIVFWGAFNYSKMAKL